MCFRGREIAVVPCIGLLPLCHHGFCIPDVIPTDPPGPSVAPHPPTYDCTGEGFFPDPDDCKKYHYCLAANLLVTSYTCPTDYVYNANNRNCILQESPEQCVTITCQNPDEFVVYSANPQYYASCDANLKASVRRCAFREEFDVASGKCQFTCQSDGYFPGYSPVEFFFCYFRSSLALIRMTCPDGMIFDTDTHICVRS